MGRARGTGDLFDAVIGRTSGIPSPIMPTENIGIMSGAIRKKPDTRRDDRGTKRGGSMVQATFRDPKSGRKYGGLIKDGVPQFKKPDFVSDEDFNKKFPTQKPQTDPRENRVSSRIPVNRLPGRKTYDPSKPSAVQETTRVNVQDPTLGGPPEREVPIPKEKDMTPRGPAPFAPDEEAAAKQRFFETMFERAANERERREIESAEERDIRRVSGMGGSERNGAGMTRGRRMLKGGSKRREYRDSMRKDFTRKRPERRRSREERAAFRDRYVSTLGSNFFS